AVRLHDAPNQARDAGRLRTVEAVILAVDIVHHFADRPKGAVAQVKSTKQGLEGAALSDVRVFRLEHVEAQLACSWLVPSRGDELEPRVRIDESADQPSTCHAIHVNVFPCYPGATRFDLVWRSPPRLPALDIRPCTGEHRVELLIRDALDELRLGYH